MTRIKEMVLSSDLHATKFFLALSSILMSLLLFWPNDLFSKQTYSVMKSIANEHVWATAFLLHGLIALWSLLKSHNTVVFFLLDALLGCVLWSSSCIAILVSGYPPAAVISTGISTAFASWWILVRYSLDTCILNNSMINARRRIKG